MKPINVLLIEDSTTHTVMIRNMLSAATGTEFELHTADRLSTGLRRLSQGGIDVLLLDLGLPDSDGLETFEKVKPLSTRVPIVVLTAEDDETVAVNALRQGAADYLVKGEVTANWLMRSLRYAIERQQTDQGASVRAQPRRQSQPSSLNIETEGDKAVARFLESRILGAETLEAVEQELFRLVNREGCRDLFLDFTGVEYVSNAALGLFLSVHKKLHAAGGTLRLGNLSPEVYDHFATRRFDKILNFASESENLPAD